MNEPASKILLPDVCADTGEGVIGLDTRGVVTFLNAAAEALTGWCAAQAGGRPFADVANLIDAEKREPFRSPFAQPNELAVTSWPRTEGILVRRDGFDVPIEHCATAIRDWEGRVAGAVVILRQISVAETNSVKAAQFVQHDCMTGLPNRVLLNDRLTQAISLSRRDRSQTAVLFVDLDGFKNINDSMGHAVGDQLLKSVATRLASCVRRSDTVSRQGGDEFVVVLTQLDDPQDAATAAGKLLHVIATPHRIGPNEFHISASVGVSIYPGDGKTAEVLIRNADSAMYEAKENGRNSFQFFKQSMNIRAVERQFFEAGLRHALEQDEFQIHFQPIFNLETGEISSAEALLRWPHPERGFIPPDQFLPIAGDCGLILPIGEWVLREACKQARVWAETEPRPIPVFVNISAMEFRSVDFLRIVREAVSETKVDPRYLELEVAESALMKHNDWTGSLLQGLREARVNLVVDHFGAGHCKLTQLQKLPIDALKIDHSLVHEVCANPDSAAIVNTVIGIGGNLNKRVIASGIETQAQLDFLASHNCKEGQGFLLCRPLAADKFTKLLKELTSKLAAKSEYTIRTGEPEHPEVFTPVPTGVR